MVALLIGAQVVVLVAMMAVFIVIFLLAHCSSVRRAAR